MADTDTAQSLEDLRRQRDLLALEVANKTAGAQRLLEQTERELRRRELEEERRLAAERGAQVKAEQERNAAREAEGIRCEAHLRDDLYPALVHNAEQLDQAFSNLESLVLEHRQLTFEANDTYAGLRESGHGTWMSRRLDRSRSSLENRLARFEPLGRSGSAGHLPVWDRNSTLTKLVRRAFAPFDSDMSPNGDIPEQEK